MHTTEASQGCMAAMNRGNRQMGSRMKRRQVKSWTNWLRLQEDQEEGQACGYAVLVLQTWPWAAKRGRSVNVSQMGRGLAAVALGGISWGRLREGGR